MHFINLQDILDQRKWLTRAACVAALGLGACALQPQGEGGEPAQTGQESGTWALTGALVPLANAGFESAWTGWSASGSTAISSVAHSGTRSAKLTGTTGRIQQAVTGLSPNTRYQLSGWLLGAAQLGVTGLGSADVSQAANASSWTKVNLPFTTAQGTSATLYAVYHGAEGRLDDMTLANLGPVDGGGTPSPAGALPVVSVTASADDGNLPKYAVDGDLGTRWSAPGDGAWIQFDLGSAFTVGSVQLAWYKGDTRKQNFEVQAGLSPTALATVFRGTSSGATVELERVGFPALAARYVRVVGHGNNVSTWNSLAEAVVESGTPSGAVDAGTPDSSSSSGTPPGSVDAGTPDSGSSSGTPSAGTLDPAVTPGRNFDLSHWKLTIPGPTEFSPSQLASYTSKWFYTDPADGSMVFWLDSSAQGTTSNSSYVRSELREMQDPSDNGVNWPTTGTHVMNAELALHYTTQTPASVTVLQIHGVTASGSSAPPLVKMVMRDGSLWALVKTDTSGNTDDKTLLASGLGSNRFTSEVRVQDNHLIISVNGVVKLDKDISYWTFVNFFKAGCYPQATSGISEVHFYQLSVHHS